MLALPAVLLSAALASHVLAQGSLATTSRTSHDTEPGDTTNSTYTWTTSGRSTSATSTGLAIGDFIASGLGIVPTTTLPASTIPTPHSSSTDDASGSSLISSTSSSASSSTAHSQSGAGNVSGSGFAPTSALNHTSVSGSGFAPTAASSTLTISAQNHTSAGNASLDVCWSQWASYWDDIAGFTTQRATGCQTSVSIQSSLYTLSDNPASTGTYTFHDAKTLSNGPFIFSTTTSDYTSTVTFSARPGTTGVYTELDGSRSCEYTPDSATITTPPCSLPTYVPQCQASWSAFVASGYQGKLPGEVAGEPGPFPSSPACSQASMDPKTCSWFQSSYVQNFGQYVPMPGYVFPTGSAVMSSGYVLDSTGIGSWIWPTQTSLAPSCTLGCARCAVTGGTIQFLYWPPTTAGPSPTTPVVARVLNTTLTYPTVYIHFEEVYASDSCQPVGPTIRNTIVPIPNTADLSSTYVSLIDRGYGGNTGIAPVTTITASFNIDELRQPIPYSVYSKQDWCQSWIWEQENRAAILSNDTTISPVCSTTDSYKPILWLPSSILQNLNPAWAGCSADVRGVYDPPTALQPITNMAIPTTRNPIATTSASPSSGLTPPVAAPTAAPETEPPQPSSMASPTTAVDPGSTAVVPEPTRATSINQPAVPDPAGPTLPTQASLADSPGASSVGSPTRPASPATSNDPSAPASDGGQQPQQQPAVSSVSNEPVNLPSQDPSTRNIVSGTAMTSLALASPVGEAGSPPLPTSIISAGDPPADGTNIGAIVASLAAQATTSSASADPLLAAIGQIASFMGDSAARPAATLSNGEALSAIASGSSVVLVASGSTVVIASGQIATFSGHTIAASGASAVAVDGDPAVSIPHVGSSPADPASPTNPSEDPQLAVATLISAGSLFLSQGSSIATLAAGQQTTFAGHTISAPLSTNVVVADGSTIIPGESAAPTTGTGHSLAIVESSGALIVSEGSSATTLSAGRQATFTGHTISVPLSTGVVVVDGTTTKPIEGAANAAETDQPLAIFESAGVLVASQGSSSTILSPAEETVFAGHTLSVAASSGIVVLDGMRKTTAGTAPSPAIYSSAGVLIASEGSSVITLAPGQQSAFGGHTLSAATDLGSMVIDGTQTTVAGVTPSLAVYESAGSLIVSQNDSAITLAAGERTTFAQHTLSAAASGAVVVDGTQTTVAGAAPSLSVFKSGGAFIASEGGSSITLAPGEQTSFAGHIVSAAAPSAVVVDGTQTIAAGAAPSLSVFESGGALIASEGYSSITLGPGEQTSFAGHTLSAAPGADVVILDGTRTITAHAHSSTSPHVTSMLPTAGISSPGTSSGSSTTTVSAGVKSTVAGHGWTILMAACICVLVSAIAA